MLGKEEHDTVKNEMNQHLSTEMGAAEQSQSVLLQKIVFVGPEGGREWGKPLSHKVCFLSPARHTCSTLRTQTAAGGMPPTSALSPSICGRGAMIYGRGPRSRKDPLSLSLTATPVGILGSSLVLSSIKAHTQILLELMTNSVET